MKHTLTLIFFSLTLSIWAAVPNIIRTQPQGSLRTYIRHGQAFYPYYGEATMGSQKGSVIDIVTSPDGHTIYMKNPISQAATSTWIEGTIEDGRIHVPTDQYVQYFPDYGYGWKTAVLRLQSYDEVQGASYYLDTETSEVVFTISADGNTITMDALSAASTQGDYPSAMYALVYDDDYTFVGYADYESIYTPYDMTYPTLPSGIEPEQWTFTYSNAQPGEYEVLPAVRQGDKVYLAGLSLHDPDAAIVGEIHNGIVSFSSHQYVGYHSGYLLYAIGATYEPKDYYEDGELIFTTNVMTPQPAIQFTLDEATRTLRAEGQQALVLNMGDLDEDQNFNYMSVALDPAFQLPLTEGVVKVKVGADTNSYDLQGRSYVRQPRKGITITCGKKWIH